MAAVGAKGIFIIGAKRTPFCNYGGPLREMQASHVFAAAAKEAISAANVDPTCIDSTVVGNINFLSQCDGGKTPRYCGIYSGVPLTSTALGVNKTCGTGLQAVITGAVDILTGTSRITLTGGTEVMSSLPFLVRNIRFGAVLGGTYQLEDHIKKFFPDSHTGSTLQKMAEELAKKYRVSRDDTDEFAWQCHLKFKKAQESKLFEPELASITGTVKRKNILVTEDQIPRLNVALEELSTQAAVLDDGNVITAGNSSAPADGAAALLLAGEDSIKSHNLVPLVRVAGWSTVGVDPKEGGIAGIQAVKKLLEEQRLLVDDVDLFEINETFASQALITARELNIDLSKVNVSGGAVALGHPVSATGARMLTHLVYQIGQRNIKRAIATSGCGGGQGIAVLLEKI